MAEISPAKGMAICSQPKAAANPPEEIQLETLEKIGRVGFEPGATFPCLSA